MGRKFVVPQVILSVLPKPSTKVLRQLPYVNFNTVSSQSLLTCAWCFWKTSVYLLPSKGVGNILTTLSHYTKWLPLYSIKPGSGWSVHDLPGIVGAAFPNMCQGQQGCLRGRGWHGCSIVEMFPDAWLCEEDRSPRSWLSPMIQKGGFSPTDW